MHLLISLLLNAVALIITSKIVPGIVVEDFGIAVLAAIIIGLVNTFIRPLLLILTAPINLLTLGLFTFVINALMLYLASLIVPGFVVDGAWAAILGAIVLSIVSTILSSLAKGLEKTSK
jgi:putative membrane protein